MPRLPERVVLPSGRPVRCSHAAADRAATKADPPLASRPPIAAAFDLLGGPGVLRTEEGEEVDVANLALADAHTLRACLLRAGVLEEPPVELRCDNCDAPMRAEPAKQWEWGPFVDGELDDEILDRPFDFDAEHACAPIRVGGRWARTVRLARRSVGESERLWQKQRGAVLITPAVVAAMGVQSLGPERRATVMAEALDAASDEAWYDLVDLFHRAHYPARLAARVRCPACGADQELDVPAVRELGRGPRESDADREVVDLDTFEAMVRRSAEQVYRRRGVQNIGLLVEAGVPECDDGGVPLFGCYTPGGEDPDLGIPQPPEIRIFYRTFQNEQRASPDFDLAAEIHETLDHEVTHHLHFLAGDDPLDDEERAEIIEEERRMVGRREHRRRALGELGAEVGGFFRVAWPLLVIALLATLLTRWL